MTNSRKGRYLKKAASFLIAAFFLVSGCASPSLLAQKKSDIERLSNFSIITSVTIVEGKIMSDDEIKLKDNFDASDMLANKAASILNGKGYAVRPERAGTIGMSAEPAKTYRVVMADSSGYNAGKDTGTQPPFATLPDDMDRERTAKLFRELKAGVARKDNFPAGIGDAALVITASGRYISGGQMAGNVAATAIALPLFLIAGAASGGKGSGPDMSGMYSYDTLSLEAYIVDLNREAVVWHDSAALRKDNPEGQNFIKELETILKDMPVAARR